MWGHIVVSIFKQKSIVIPAGSRSDEILMKWYDTAQGQEITKCRKQSKLVQVGKQIWNAEPKAMSNLRNNTPEKSGEWCRKQVMCRVAMWQSHHLSHSRAYCQIASAQVCSCNLYFAVGPYNGPDEISVSVNLLFLTCNSNPNANLHLWLRNL